MNESEFYSFLKNDFPHNTTPKQDIALQLLAKFVSASSKNETFLLKGYAGTGKTTIVGTLVKNLLKIKKKSVLLAPTGRAAKVISNYSNKQAFTIHKKIYFPKSKQGGVSFTLKENKHRDTVFIVDEASMIPDNVQDSKLFENGSLLDDLMHFVYSGHNCKILLIGDSAQLPPFICQLALPWTGSFWKDNTTPRSCLLNWTKWSDNRRTVAFLLMLPDFVYAWKMNFLRISNFRVKIFQI